MKIIFFIFLQILSLSFCYIKIPLKYYPCQTFDESNPSNTFHNLVMQRLFARIEVGSPKQSIYFSLELEKNEFYLSRSDARVQSEKYDKYNLNNFKQDASSSLYFLEGDQQEVYYSTSFLLASKAKDLFFFGNQKVEMDFYLADDLNEDLPGELGLQIEPIDDLNSAFDTAEKSFLKKLKNSGIISNYVWTIMYTNDNKDNADAYLYIGDYLHNIDSNDLTLKYTKFKQDSLSSINTFIYQKTIMPEFEMNKLVMFKGNNPDDIINDIKYSKNYLRVKLDYNLCGIQASEIIRVYLEMNIFNDDNGCHKGYFNYRSKYIFYYCDKNPTAINKIKSNFPSLKFIHQDFNFNFTITVDDLIVEKPDYYYFLIFFSDYSKYEWRLGRPFVNKYNFMLDQDGKKIMFYSEQEKIELPGVQSKSLVILLIVLIIIFLLIGIFLGRKIYKTKIKKHINILDDNFDYSLESENKEIEMSKKLYDN